MLPGLNADIIDQGVLPGDTDYIRSHGAADARLVALVQVAFADRRRLLRRPGRRWASGATSAPRCSTGSPATRPARSAHFGAPSLITRITNDVQQVQMLVVMACTMAIAAPITIVVGVIMALRQDVGLSTVLLVAMPGRGRSCSARSSPAWCRPSSGCRTASTASTGCCASRSPASASCAPSSASPRNGTGSRRPTPTSRPRPCGAAG